MRPAASVDSARSWVVVAAAFAAMFASFGIAYSFGAFLEPMAAEFGTGRGATSTFFALTSLTYFGLGALSGVAVDRYGPRRVLLAGGAALGAGLAATSQAGELWIGLVTYGLGVGIGVACAYVPMVAVVGGWFERRRTLAIGVAVTGIGLGTLTVAPLAAAMIDELGWRTTHLVLGVGGAAVLVVCALVVPRPPVRPGPAALTLEQAVRNGDYRRLYLASGLLTVALFVPFVHLPGYAEQAGADRVAAAALVGVIGAASTAGRLVLGVVAARTGALRAFQGCFLVMGASFALWGLGGGYGVLVVFAVVLGVGYGGFVAIGPAVVAERFGTTRLGGLLGVLYTSAGLGSAVGAPLAGAAIDATGSYLPVVAGCLALGLAAWLTTLTVGR
ncbi:putative MFS family arabinose efflux permease [Geodermatophilus tzadiensis]|uniref:Putative MFS family arabinose efflux permease n=1 Tax=Geodermatophilus tzadiensis TaxID=1137988 RepID=A0A2T0TVM8_9ACTN|nr:MFS transporter [Geodermatophilus tzadiensis]PRY49721.1 putative MFS family arabinose efflux permease [Geodermatophilus tzadiensis]